MRLCEFDLTCFLSTLRIRILFPAFSFLCGFSFQAGCDDAFANESSWETGIPRAMGSCIRSDGSRCVYMFFFLHWMMCMTGGASKEEHHEVRGISSIVIYDSFQIACIPTCGVLHTVFPLYISFGDPCTPS